MEHFQLKYPEIENDFIPGYNNIIHYMFIELKYNKILGKIIKQEEKYYLVKFDKHYLIIQTYNTAFTVIEKCKHAFKSLI